MLAVKSVQQRYAPSQEVLGLLECFRQMVNDCIRIGLRETASSLKRLSKAAYCELRRYECPSYYKLCAISRAAGILTARRKSIRRGFPDRNPYAVKPQLVSCYGFKVENGLLRIPLGERRYFDISLTQHTREVLSDPALRVRSFTLTASTVNLCISKEVQEVSCTETVGVDLNLRNLTYGNEHRVVQFDLSKAAAVAERTRCIVSSLKRDDVRARRALASKYGRRRAERVKRLLHCVTKRIVKDAYEAKAAIVLEEIKGIRRLYGRGNGQGHGYRGQMNSWPFGEAQRQIAYKARWLGLPVVYLTARGTSRLCPQCGERLLESRDKPRQLWCGRCGRWMDRDVVAAINLSHRRPGRLRFDRSEGGAVEAMRGNPATPVILRVDASKRNPQDPSESTVQRSRG